MTDSPCRCGHPADEHTDPHDGPCTTCPCPAYRKAGGTT